MVNHSSSFAGRSTTDGDENGRVEFHLDRNGRTTVDVDVQNFVLHTDPPVPVSNDSSKWDDHSSRFAARSGVRGSESNVAKRIP